MRWIFHVTVIAGSLAAASLGGASLASAALGPAAKDQAGYRNSSVPTTASSPNTTASNVAAEVLSEKRAFHRVATRQRGVRGLTNSIPIFPTGCTPINGNPAHGFYCLQEFYFAEGWGRIDIYYVYDGWWNYRGRIWCLWNPYNLSYDGCWQF